MLALTSNERVMVCPLGWGLGHATRVIPIISSLLAKGCHVIVAGDSQSITLLKKRFPNLEFIPFPSLRVKLTKGRNQTLALLKIAIRLLFSIRKENRVARELIKKHKVDVLISDNRYGLYSSSITTVLITHQLKVMFPKPFKWVQPIGERFVRRYAQRFTYCWIPDNPNGFKLSGELSQPKIMHNNAEFIGLLSRFYGKDYTSNSVDWELLGIVSGPPPHRELLVKELVNLSNRLNIRSLIVQGLPSDEVSKTKEGMATLVNHLEDDEMARAITSSKYIICRSGYSTLMDLLALKRTALLVPTPGQTEQEYLARYLKENNMFEWWHQHKLAEVELSMLNKSSSIFQRELSTFFA